MPRGQGITGVVRHCAEQSDKAIQFWQGFWIAASAAPPRNDTRLCRAKAGFDPDEDRA